MQHQLVAFKLQPGLRQDALDPARQRMAKANDMAKQASGQTIIFTKDAVTCVVTLEIAGIARTDRVGQKHPVMMVQINIGMAENTVVALNCAIIGVFVPSDVTNDTGRQAQTFDIVR